eukprot:CAMPEP_0170569630 /NCGR_PEP_ID=MMETSP0224-20130122/659_1 /TAXON_ID=285029 /ORGANISM="Togula jolla, Strain CCCM 725" /LENGTH=80 /DNA_ID=CAMNT_0010891813 /DNA_START=57 /DNA_END=299 /DNA_ORIENTATION=+
MARIVLNRSECLSYVEKILTERVASFPRDEEEGEEALPQPQDEQPIGGIKALYFWPRQEQKGTSEGLRSLGPIAHETFSV